MYLLVRVNNNYIHSVDPVHVATSVVLEASYGRKATSAEPVAVSVGTVGSGALLSEVTFEGSLAFFGVLKNKCVVTLLSVARLARKSCTLEF